MAQRFLQQIDPLARIKKRSGVNNGVNNWAVLQKVPAAQRLFVRHPLATWNRTLAALNAWSLGIAMKSKLLFVAATLAACTTVLNAAERSWGASCGPRRFSVQLLQNYRKTKTSRNDCFLSA
jgi:hypothetical protein